MMFARLSVALACLLALAGPASARMFDPQTAQLANGMQIVVVPNHRAPILSHMVWYKVGAADETPGKSGLAHLLEHLMFKGTPSIPPGEFSKIVARLGGRDNAFTSSDYTAYYQTIAADKLEQVMRMEAERMKSLQLDEANFRTELKVVLEERRMRVDNNPAAQLHEQMEAALFLNSPYHRPIIGWESEIAGLTLDDALAFYRRWYGPNNAILVVAGDVEMAQVKPLAEKYFGELERSDSVARLRTQEPPARAARRLTLVDGRVGQPAWSRLYMAPSLGAGDKAMAYPLEVLAEILGGGNTSRLYTALTLDKSAAVAARADYESTAVDWAVFRLSATPAPGVAPDKLEPLVDEQIAKILKSGIPADEVERAKARLIAAATFERDSLTGASHVLGAALATGQSAEQVEQWPDRIAAVTADQVWAAAKAVLDPKGSVTGILLPDPNAPRPAGGRALAPFTARELH
jgi:zinc protease